MIAKSLFAAGSGLFPFAADHLWQSSLFACAAAACALALRNAQARVRYLLWLAASLKFLVPFALLSAIGSQLAAGRAAATSGAGIYSVVVQAGQPFTAARTIANLAPASHPALRLLPQMLAALWLLGAAAVLAGFAIRWLRVRSAVCSASLRIDGREVEALRTAERTASLRRPIQLLESSHSLEPGIFGVLRPVLIWPAGISGHLEDAHLTAILAHEVWHVRRRDNLAALCHMFVQAVFWFHPLVWWLGAKLVEERERACDEAVLGLGNAPGDYAESILKACKFCVESPLACVSGVSGSNLKRRIVRIMNRQLGKKLSLGGKLLLASLGVAAIATPVVIGLFNPAPVRAQGPLAAVVPDLFEDVTVKANHSQEQRNVVEVTSTGFTIADASVRELIELAYGVRDYQLSGGPAWIDTERFDIDGKAAPGSAVPAQDGALTMIRSEKMVIDGPDGPGKALPPHVFTIDSGVESAIGPPRNRLQASLRSILASRFNLKLTHETRDLPVYALVAGGGSFKLSPIAEPEPQAGGDRRVDSRVLFRIGNGSLSLQGGNIDAFAAQLGSLLDHPVEDKTGLTGKYNLDLHWNTGGDEAGSISSAVEEQLGLRLEQRQAPTATIVIDQIEAPSEN
jgi:bla regulator protein blaR1